MKIDSRLYALILCSLFSWAQFHAQELTSNGEVIFSKENKIDKRQLQYVVGENLNKETIVLKNSSKFSEGVVLQLFDDNLNLIRAKEIDLNCFEKKPFKKFISTFLVNKKLYLFCDIHDKKGDSKKLIVHTVDMSNSDFKASEGKVISTLEYDGVDDNDTGFSILHSDDESKILIITTYDVKGNANLKMELGVYDDNFNELHSREITLPYDQKDFFVHQTIVDNSGNIHFFGPKNLSKEESKNAQSPYLYTLISYSKELKEISETTLGTKDDQFTDMIVDVNGDIVSCVGLYLEDNTLAGSYSLKYSIENKNQLHKNIRPFDVETITYSMSENDKEKAEKLVSKGETLGLYQMSIKDYLRKADGGAYVVGEEYYTDERKVGSSSNSGGTQQFQTSYHRNNIIIISMNAEGDILWNRTIPKTQSSHSNFHISYFPQVLDSDLLLLFNETKAQIEKAEKSSVVFDNKIYALLNYARISESGSIEKGIMHKYINNEVLAPIKNAKLINENPTSLTIRDREDYHVMKVKLNP